MALARRYSRAGQQRRGRRSRRGKLGGGAQTPLTKLGSKLEIWWDIDDASTITLSGPDATDVADKTTNGHDLSEATNPPAYSATSGPNSTGALTFDGVAEHMTTTANGLTVANGDRPGALIIAQLNNTAADERLIEFQAETRQDFGIRLVSSGGGRWQTRQVYTPGPAFQQYNHTDTPDTAWHLFEIHYLSTGRILSVDGTDVAGSDSNAADGWTGHVSIGAYNGGSFLDGSVAEVLFLNDEPTGPERTWLHNYFSTKHGLTIE